MYGEYYDPKPEQDREKFFKKYGYECSCHPGFVVCLNCMIYYSKFGKLDLWVSTMWRKFKDLFRRNK